MKIPKNTSTELGLLLILCFIAYSCGRLSFEEVTHSVFDTDSSANQVNVDSSLSGSKGQMDSRISDRDAASLNDAAGTNDATEMNPPDATGDTATRDAVVDVTSDIDANDTDASDIDASDIDASDIDASNNDVDAYIANDSSADTSTTTNDAATYTCVATLPASGTDSIIDDLEDGDDVIYEREGRRGMWYIVNDGSAGTQTPAIDDPFVPYNEGVNDSSYSARTWGSGFTSWGAGMGVSLNSTSTDQYPYDASQYNGIQFCTKGVNTVTVSIASSETVPVDRGGNCTNSCFDYHAIDIELTSEWTLHQIAWDEITQAGWGAPADFHSDEIFYIEFAFGVIATFDTYIDNLGFY